MLLEKGKEIKAESFDHFALFFFFFTKASILGLIIDLLLFSFLVSKNKIFIHNLKINEHGGCLSIFFCQNKSDFICYSVVSFSDQSLRTHGICFRSFCSQTFLFFPLQLTVDVSMIVRGCLEGFSIIF
ncbi:hypothetical protein NC653_015413 [Populus alba x Populus x berolinensis]|uniref:Uncharacterized protein n=1 Tax=Populus alba x Populus x berolinensis TaxID=444605 RepID=A0AAD6QKH7_9ROSI|nr:hypothetical protein NC653_015413 [Populus alba x Populus x berolinensis]